MRLGLGACSDSALKDLISITSGGLSQNNETTTTGGTKTRESALSLFFVITYFDFDSTELIAETRKVLDRAVNKYSKSLSARVVISGHADEKGTREYNLALGHQRAAAVADYMVAAGIDGLRIKKVSFGKEKPLIKGSNEEAWSRNRRVEINGE
jgi:peptidoglycan-associated lipoprotein